MASIIDVRTIANLLDMQISELQIVAIAKHTPNDFDTQWVVDKLILKNTISAKDIENAIHKAPRNAKSCQQCHDQYISGLALTVLKEMAANGINGTFPNVIAIPKALYSCPNCGKNKNSLANTILTMSEEEQAWMYVTLYDYATYHLGQRQAPEQFETTTHWPTISLQPALSKAQASMLSQIYINAQGSEIAPQAHASVRRAVQAMDAQSSLPF